MQVPPGRAGGSVGLAEVQHVGVERPRPARPSRSRRRCPGTARRPPGDLQRGQLGFGVMPFCRIWTMSTPPANAARQELREVALLLPGVRAQVEPGSRSRARGSCSTARGVEAASAAPPRHGIYAVLSHCATASRAAPLRPRAFARRAGRPRCRTARSSASSGVIDVRGCISKRSTPSARAARRSCPPPSPGGRRTARRSGRSGPRRRRPTSAASRVRDRSWRTSPGSAGRNSARAACSS